MERQAKSGTSIAALSAAYQAAVKEHAAALYGVDLCFIVDCTGSMGSWIKATKDKIVEITQGVQQIPTLKQDPPNLRVAFVGYRDHCDGNDRLVSYDFFPVKEAGAIEAFKKFLDTVAAKGGGDDPEDVTGGMNLALTGIRWKASTRLIVHFADAPCHGKMYHSVDDDYPAGCPNGLVPEDLLQKCLEKRIDYYFGEINSSTSQMRDMMMARAAHIGKNDHFKVLAMTSGVREFLPVVLNSVRVSMFLSGVIDSPAPASVPPPSPPRTSKGNSGHSLVPPPQPTGSVLVTSAARSSGVTTQERDSFLADLKSGQDIVTSTYSLPDLSSLLSLPSFDSLLFSSRTAAQVPHVQQNLGRSTHPSLPALLLPCMP